MLRRQTISLNSILGITTHQEPLRLTVPCFAAISQGKRQPQEAGLSSASCDLFVKTALPASAGGSPCFGRAKKRVDTDRLVTAKIKIPLWLWKGLQEAAQKGQMSVSEYLQMVHAQFKVAFPSKTIAPQASDILIGHHRGRITKTEVKTLFGPEQIFDEWIHLLRKTKNYAQISMYNFENLNISGGTAIDGAETSPGWYKQQQILALIEEKAKQGVRFQIILDNSVMRKRNKYGIEILPRSHTNQGMIEHFRKLREEKGLPIEVIEFPRDVARIYHVKLLISDGKRAIVGGMNLSNHSAANWDACVSIHGPEVANLQSETFHPDWMFALHRKQHQLSRAQLSRTLPPIIPVSHPALAILNTMQREYEEIGLVGKEQIGDYLKQRLNAPDLRSVHSEQFIATHPEIKQRLIDLHEQGADIRILHSSSVVDQFPTTRKPIFDLIKAGVPVRFYNEFREIKQKLHSKWTVLNGKEILIGSANLSAAGLESNAVRKHSRGNRDMAIAIPSAKIARAFIKQFELDWDFSPPKHPAGYGQFEKAPDSPRFTKIIQTLRNKLP